MKKIYLLSTVMILLLALFAGSVAAADLAVTSTSVADGKISLGTIDRDDFEKDHTFADKVLTFTANADLTDVVATFDLKSNAWHTGAASDSVTTVANASTFDVTLSTLEILESDGKDYNDFNGNPISGEGEHALGELTITDGADSITYTVVYTTESLLGYEKDKVKVEFTDIDGNDEDDKVEDGESVSEVKPGYEVTITVPVENKIQSDNRYDSIENLEVTITGDELDDGDDLDEEEDDVEIDGEDVEELTFSFKLTKELEANDYEVTISSTALGEDEFGGKHSLPTFKFDLEVERNKHEIVITEAKLAQTLMECDETTNTMYVTILNIGEKDEDNVEIQVSSPSLGIDLSESDIDDLVSIEEDEDDAEYDARFNLRLPEGTKSGKYNIAVRTLLSSTVKAEETVVLTYNACKEETVIIIPDNKDDVVPAPVDKEDMDKQIEDEKTTTDKVEEKTDKTSEDLKSSPAYIGLLILGYIAIIGLIIVLVMYIFKKN